MKYGFNTVSTQRFRRLLREAICIDLHILGYRPHLHTGSCSCDNHCRRPSVIAKVLFQQSNGGWENGGASSRTHGRHTYRSSRSCCGLLDLGDLRIKVSCWIAFLQHHSLRVKLFLGHVVFNHLLQHGYHFGLYDARYDCPFEMGLSCRSQQPNE